MWEERDTEWVTPVPAWSRSLRCHSTRPECNGGRKSDTGKKHIMLWSFLFPLFVSSFSYFHIICFLLLFILWNAYFILIFTNNFSYIFNVNSVTDNKISIPHRPSFLLHSFRSTFTRSVMNEAMIRAEWGKERGTEVERLSLGVNHSVPSGLTSSIISLHLRNTPRSAKWPKGTVKRVA